MIRTWIWFRKILRYKLHYSIELCLVPIILEFNGGVFRRISIHICRSFFLFFWNPVVHEVVFNSKLLQSCYSRLCFNGYSSQQWVKGLDFSVVDFSIWVASPSVDRTSNFSVGLFSVRRPCNTFWIESVRGKPGYDVVLEQTGFWLHVIHLQWRLTANSLIRFWISYHCNK